MSHFINYYNTLAFLIIIVSATFTSCGEGKYHEQLLLAEEQVTQSADSCARLLATIPVKDLSTEEEALYGLVSSWLLYRQYANEIPEEPLEKAYKFYRESKDPLRRAQVYFLHSVINQDQERGQVSQWMEDLYSACLAVEQTNDNLLASQIYQNYSLKFTEVKQFDKALVWIDKFVEAAEKSGNRREYVQSLVFKANNCLYAEEERIKKEYHIEDGKEVAKHTQFAEAFKTIYKALSIAKESQMDVEQGRIYTQLAVYHSRCQNLDSLLYYAQLSVMLNEQLYEQGLRKQLPHYVTLSDAYRKLGNADSAIYYARKTFDTPGMPLRNKREAARMIYNTYSELKNDYKTSLVWMRICNQLNDSINQQTIASNIEAVQDAAVQEHENHVLREERKNTINWLMLEIVLLVCLLSFILYRFYCNRKRYRKHLQDLEDDFNHKIEEMRAIEQARSKEQEEPFVANIEHFSLQSKPETKITIKGSTREQIEVDPLTILFLTSENNYIKVFYIDTIGKVQSKIIRQTMGNVESQLNDYPYIIRCHRAFIVNLKHVEHANTSPSGLILSFDVSTLTVPVSKTYISLVKASIG